MCSELNFACVHHMIIRGTLWINCPLYIKTEFSFFFSQLLIIHFDDGTFQVLPSLVSIKAKEVNEMSDLPVHPHEWSAAEYFSHYHLFTKHKGHENKRYDHRVSKLLTDKQGLLFSTIRKCLENSVENMHAYVRVKRINFI